MDPLADTEKICCAKQLLVYPGNIIEDNQGQNRWVIIINDLCKFKLLSKIIPSVIIVHLLCVGLTKLI